MCTSNFHVKFTIFIGSEFPLHHLGPYFHPFTFIANMPFQKKTKHVHNHFPNKYVDPSVIYFIYSSHFAHYKNHTQSTIIYILDQPQHALSPLQTKIQLPLDFQPTSQNKPKYIYSQSPKCNWYTCITNFNKFCALQ